MNLLDLTELLRGYQVAKETYPSPMVSKTLTVDGEKMHLALIHPKLMAAFMKLMQVDPRSTESA